MQITSSESLSNGDFKKEQRVHKDAQISVSKFEEENKPSTDSLKKLSAIAEIVSLYKMIFILYR